MKETIIADIAKPFFHKMFLEELGKFIAVAIIVGILSKVINLFRRINGEYDGPN